MQQLLIVGRYRLLDLVGSGGMGRVWLARDEMLHRDVAVKEVVPPEWLTEAERVELRQRTMREARTAARLNHPNVVRIYDVVHTGDNPCIVMEYIAGRSMQQILTTDGPFAPYPAARIGLALLDALRAAHAAGVLHRDVKPHNVLIGENGRVVLSDFGLATFDGGDGAMTRPGMVLGSPQYVAPERARDGTADARTDLWSLGATLYAAVEGKSPYARPTTMATLTALATEQPATSRRAGPLRPVLTGLLRRDPAKRLTAGQAEKLLRAVVAAEPAPPQREAVGAPGPPAAPRNPGARLRRARRWLAAGGAVVLVAAGVALVSRGGPPGTGPVPAPPPATVRPVAFPCARPAGPYQAKRVVPAPTPAGERYPLAAGWTWYTDPTGFRVAAPVGWLRFADGTAACFRDPSGFRALSLETVTPPADLVAYWRDQERRLTGSGALPGYRQVQLAPMAGLHDGAAVWECGWVGPGGERMRSSRLLVRTSPVHAHVLAWQTPELDWPANHDRLLMIRRSFRPAG
ncbi:serine/threonine-protein kinase [Micromonospora sp. CPCC 206060]|uniref:serine/threonine-protein kinase n=1 Tax=Micromonospora sp. CPCC 206060 TaxID=3122406 RepID=UPI002FF0DAFA